MTARGRILARFVTPARRVSIDAALAEAAAAGGGSEAARWRSAARRMLVHGIIFGPVLKGLVSAVVVGAVAATNESSSDIANQVTFGCILTGSGLIGFVWARRAWLPGLLIGCTVGIEHAVAVALGTENPDTHLPPGWWGSLSLFVLLGPALIAAYSGVGLRRLIAGRRS
jgi:hypothetical protein